MTPFYRNLLFVAIGFFVLAGVAFLRADSDADMPPGAKHGGELDPGAEYDGFRVALPEFAAKFALGNNANAALSLDLIANGGAGNQRDDGVTTGAVSGRGTKIAIEVFATGVRTSLLGFEIEFDLDSSLVALVRAEDSIHPQLGRIRNKSVVAFGSLPPRLLWLSPSGFLVRAEFETVANVTGREFSIGIESVTLAGTSSSIDTLTTSSEISFNAAPSPDFDGDGTVGFSDFLIFAGAFGSSQGDGKYNAAQDLNSDGSVDFTDFLIFAGDFGSQVPPSGGGGTPSGGGETVTIADANLRAVIADSLGKARNAPITREEMTTLTRIDALNKGIRNLTGLEHATNLRWLNLGSERVNDAWVNSNDISDLSPLANLTNLRLLGLGRNSISDISALSRLTNLTWMTLYKNNIRDISALSNLTNLEILYLWGNSISSISALSRLTNLIELYIGSVDISDISSLSNLTNLTDLFLDRNSISSLTALSRLTNLTRLNLYNNSISDISPLVANTGLGDGDRVDLRDNPLSSTSRNTHIPTLQRRGVKVEFDGSGGVRACTAGLVVNPGESCTYKGATFSVSSSGTGTIIAGGLVMRSGRGIQESGTINGVRWNFHATKNSGSNSWTIHVAN